MYYLSQDIFKMKHLRQKQRRFHNSVITETWPCFATLRRSFNVSPVVFRSASLTVARSGRGGHAVGASMSWRWSGRVDDVVRWQCGMSLASKSTAIPVSCGRAMLTKTQRLVLGLFILLLVDVIWVSSSELTKVCLVSVQKYILRIAMIVYYQVLPVLFFFFGFIICIFVYNMFQLLKRSLV